jgi:hypothetical protein
VYGDKLILQVAGETKLAKTKAKQENETAMDYAEHEKTYRRFLWLAKWSVLHTAAILVAMAAGFLGGMGLAGGLLIFIVLMAIAYFLA